MSAPIRLGRCLGLVFTSLISLVAAEVAAGPVKPLLHPLFSDEAVLQRGKPVAVWGWAAPGAEVMVRLVAEGELKNGSATVRATADGRWQAAIGPFPAGGPYILTATSGSATAVAKDILVGDVWLCGGQSNMEMMVGESAHVEAEKAKADWPQIRHIKVEKITAGTPQELIKGQWKAANPANVAAFTAAGYFMARQLHQELHVPIGLVNSSWGGTAAQAWISAEVLATLPDQAKAVSDFQALVKQADAQKATTGKDYPELITAWYAANDPGTATTPAWSAVEADASGWAVVQLPALFEDAGAIPKTWDGTVWTRREFTVPEAMAGKPAVLMLGRVDDMEATWINGRQLGSNESIWNHSYQVPAGVLKAGGNSIAIRFTDLAGKCGLKDKPEVLKLTPQGGTAIPLAGEWRIKPGIELAQAPPLPVRFDRTIGATSLYNGMIAPLLPMSLTGAIWYQGEANAGAAFAYRSLLPGLITDWRTRFGQGDFPFLIVSLANYMERLDQPAEANWAELREAQALVAKQVPACGLAVAIDIGDAKDIHPKNKQEVGRRLALAAQAIAYGQAIAWSGPWYAGMTIEGSAIRLKFDHLGGGLATSDKAQLTGFAIAGEDRSFVWADAKIDGDSIVVASAAVAKPVAVRYAWANNPACNLVNKAGLPAVPFRTDDWPRQAAPKK